MTYAPKAVGVDPSSQRDVLLLGGGQASVHRAPAARHRHLDLGFVTEVKHHAGDGGHRFTVRGYRQPLMRLPSPE